MNTWLTQRGRIYWYDQYALNDQATAFSEYDPERISTELVDTKADIVAVYAANQFSIAYYPSNIWPQHPNLNGRDYFGEVSERLKARGKKIIAYINWLDSRHLDWLAQPVEGSVNKNASGLKLASWANPNEPDTKVYQVTDGRWLVPCLNAPRRDEVLAVAKEICERYTPDAFHLDMFGVGTGGVCACPRCRPVLKSICGTSELSSAIIKMNWKAFIDWRMECSSSLIKALTQVLHQYGVVALHNGFAPVHLPAIDGVGEEWLEGLDVFLSECFDAFLSPHTDLNSTSLNIRWQHATGKPSWILRTSTPSHHGHWPISKTEWSLYASAAKANGCHVFGPCGVGAYPDTTTAASLLENVKYGFECFMEDSDLAEGARSAATVALVFSWATRKYESHGDCLSWARELAGWSRLLMESHVPFDVVIAENVHNADSLAAYKLVILPEIVHANESFCSAVREYARLGGHILATGACAIWNEKNAICNDYQLADVLGVSWRGFADEAFAVELPAGAAPIKSRFEQVEASGDVLTRQIAVDPDGSVFGGLDPLPMHPTVWPAATRKSFGKGLSFYVAFPIGSVYEEYGESYIAQWMEELVRLALPERPFEAMGPRTVETTLWRQEQLGRTIIHLANRSVAWSLPTDARRITEIIPVHDFILRIPTPCSNPRVECRGAEITHHIEANILVVTVKKLDAYAAVIVEETS